MPKPDDFNERNGAGRDEPRPKEGEFDGRTFLYIRTNPSDDGSEPLQPAGTPFWISPDITVTPPGGSPGGMAEAGVVNDVTVAITNAGGLPAYGATLEVFLADPSTAFTPATADPLGYAAVNLPAYNVTPVTLPWTPTPSQAGHRCMLARVSSVLTGDAVDDLTVFDVVGDRHVAQRNLHVVSMAQAQESGFHFLITNPLQERATFAIRAAGVKPTAQAQALARGALCGFTQLGESPVGVKLTANLRAEAELARTELPLGAHRISASARERGALLVGGERLLRARNAVEVAPDEAVHASLSFTRPDGARPGDVHLVEVAQIDPSTKRAVGGLWVALVA
jgi:hypothetical protein